VQMPASGVHSGKARTIVKLKATVNGAALVTLKKLTPAYQCQHQSQHQSLSLLPLPTLKPVLIKASVMAMTRAIPKPRTSA
jgi:hypothetical protein